MSSNERRFVPAARSEDVCPGYVHIVSDLYDWLQLLERQRYDYVVASTRRASNLVEIVRDKYPDVLPDYITENGLLLQTEDIAQSYVNTNQFPTVAIFDDVLVYGRNLNLFLTQFWKTLQESLRQLGVDASTEKVERDFNQSVALWIYAVNDAPTLLQSEFQWSMHTMRVLPEVRWRDLSDGISWLISDCPTANTSYVVSRYIKWRPGGYRPKSKSWIADKSMQYREDRYDYSFYMFYPAGAGIYPSVRSYVKWDQAKNLKYQYFTPYCFVPEFDADQMLRVLRLLFSYSFLQDPQTTNQCIDLLNRIADCPSRLMVYSQFVFFLLSQITLSVFFQTITPKIDENASRGIDVDKISRNFGHKEQVAPILERFCQIRWDQAQLVKLLECFGPLEQAPSVPEPSEKDSMELSNAVEQLVFAQALHHEGNAADRLRAGFTGTLKSDALVNRTGEQELGQFFAQLERRANTDGDVVSMFPVLSCLTQMMDWGDVSLKARSTRRGGVPHFYTSVRTTEMSLAIMPRKLYPYYHQFFLLAQFYWQEKSFPDRVERYFKDVIFDGDSDGSHSRMIRDVRYFAEQISQNHDIVNSMLNWGDIFDPRKSRSLAGETP